MAGKFVLKKARGGSFRFNLHAGNGQVILTSESYKTKKAAENGIASVGKNCGNDKCYDRKVAKNGQPYFNLRSGNNQVIGTSQRYSSSAAMEKGIASVKTNGGSRVDDQTT